MQNQMKLFMVLLGNLPKARKTEQHDVFFGAAENLYSLKKEIIDFWPGSPKLHIDVWREVNYVDGHKVSIVPMGDDGGVSPKKLFFINLGGYKKGEFEEFHYKLLVAAGDKGEAVRKAKETAFYKHYNLKGAESHIDEKYGVDVDDLYMIEDVLPSKFKKSYKVILSAGTENMQDDINLGYVLLSKMTQ